MMKKYLSICLFIMLFVPAAVFSGPLDRGSGYVGLQYGYLSHDQDRISGDSNPTALVAKVGYFVFNQIAIEGRYGFGLSDDSARRLDGTDSVTRGDLELDYLYGAYLTGYLPLGEIGSAYGLFGVSDVKTSFSDNSHSTPDSDSGFSFGFGANLYIPYFKNIHEDGHWSIGIEYMRYLSESGYKLTSYGLGVAVRF